MTLCKTEKFPDGFPAEKNAPPYPGRTTLHTIKGSGTDADMLLLPGKDAGNSIVQRPHPLF